MRRCRPLVMPLLPALLLLTAPLWAEVANVAVASNFAPTLKRLQSLFEAKSGHTLRISSASTGKLYLQIRNGAPHDLFLAADVARPERLEREGLTVAGSRFSYALGRLTLLSRHDTGVDCLAPLRSGNLRRLAIANPKVAPYGVAAQETLQRLGLLTSLETKLVRGENIAQVLHFYDSGNTDAALVASPLLIDRATSGAECRWPVPDDHHAPLAQQVVLLKRGAENRAALALLDFLRSDEAGALILADGYQLPGAPGR